LSELRNSTLWEVRKHKSSIVFCFWLTYITDLLVTQPDDITFSTGNKAQHGGRWRYQYSVSWIVRNMLFKFMIHTLVC